MVEGEHQRGHLFDTITWGEARAVRNHFGFRIDDAEDLGRTGCSSSSLALQMGSACCLKCSILGGA